MTTPPRQHEILSDLRRQIIDGVFPPGKRLPTRTELERQFDASSVTVQRALDRLGADGFIEARGRQGTFVPDRPPHLFHYGLVILATRGDDSWNHFWEVLTIAARDLFDDGERSMSIYEGIGGRDERHYPRLMHDVDARRFAGLIFATNPYLLLNTQVIDAPGIPRVMIGSPGALAAHVELETEPFYARALDHLAGLGRRRVALLTVPGIPAGDLELFAAAAAARGMETRRHWQQAMVISSPGWSANLTELLMRRPVDGVVPDALLITDDNLVEPAMKGLEAAGVRVPEELAVVAHANFPDPTPSPLPITRLGYDAREILRRCVEGCDRQRRERIGVTRSTVAPVFAHEVVDPTPTAPRAAPRKVVR